MVEQLSNTKPIQGRMPPSTNVREIVRGWGFKVGTFCGGSVVSSALETEEARFARQQMEQIQAMPEYSNALEEENDVRDEAAVKIAVKSAC